MAPRAKDLVNKLIAPLRLGDTVFEEFVLTGAVFAEPDAKILYTFTPGDMRIALEERSARPCLTQTSSFNVVLVTSGPAHLGRAQHRLVEHVVSLIRANDPGAVTWSGTSTLFLVPGMIGNAYDLCLRAIDVLRRVSVIVVEPGKESVTADLLTFHGVALDSKRIVPLPAGEAEAVELLTKIVAENEDASLFGVDEGLPGFNDPGKLLIAAASAFGDRLRVRSVGGPSALSMALLRLPVNLNHFIFFGVYRDELTEALDRLIRQSHEPVILFMVANIDRTVRRIAATSLPLGRDIFVACNLTCENETLLRLRPGDSLDALPTLEETTRVVLAVCPADTARPES